MSLGWQELVIDALVVIFSKLPLPDLGRCGIVCNQWNQAHLNFSLWKQICIDYYSHNGDEFSNDSKWRDVVLSDRQAMLNMKRGRCVPRRFGRKWDYVSHIVNEQVYHVHRKSGSKLSVSWVFSRYPWGSYTDDAVTETEVIDVDTLTRQTVSKGASYVFRHGDHYIGAPWINRYYYSGPIWKSIVCAKVEDTEDASELYQKLKGSREHNIRWQNVKPGFEPNSYNNKYEFDISLNSDGSPTFMLFENPGLGRDTAFEKASFCYYDLRIGNVPISEFDIDLVPPVRFVKLVGNLVVIADGMELRTVNCETKEVKLLLKFDENVRDEPKLGPRHATLDNDEIAYAVGTEIEVRNIFSGQQVLVKELKQYEPVKWHSDDYSRELIRGIGLTASWLVASLAGRHETFALFDRLAPGTPLVTSVTLFGNQFTGELTFCGTGGAKLLTVTDHLAFWDFSNSKSNTTPVRIFSIPPSQRTITTLSVAPLDLMKTIAKHLNATPLSLLSACLYEDEDEKFSMIYTTTTHNTESQQNSFARSQLTEVEVSRARAEPFMDYVATPHSIPCADGLPKELARYREGNTKHAWKNVDALGPVCVVYEKLQNGVWGFADAPLDNFKFWKVDQPKTEEIEFIELE